MDNSLPLEAQIAQVLMLAVRDFHSRLEQDLKMRQVNGIGQRHQAVFLHLGQYGPSRNVDLAQAAGIRPQSMMVIIQELEGMGLIERSPDPSDSRAKLVNFTGKGEDLIKELTRSTITVWQQYEEILGKSQLMDVFQGLEKLSVNKSR